MRVISILLVIFCIVGCSSAPTRVLHWRKKPFMNLKYFADDTGETFPIQPVDEIVLTYDRTPLVRQDNELPDGSVWVYYNLCFKNVGTKSKKLNLKNVYLEQEGEQTKVQLNKDIEHPEAFVAEAKTTNVIPIKFHLSKSLNNSDNPLKMILPINEKQNAEIELWVW